MKAFSLDLRQRILDAYDAGEGSRQIIAKRFKVSDSFVKNRITSYNVCYTKLLRLFSKLGSLEGIELYMLIGGLVILGLLIWAVASYAKRAKAKALEAPEAEAAKPNRTQVLVYGALSITLAFVLSYFKLFTLPYEGSITLLSMLPRITSYNVCYTKLLRQHIGLLVCVGKDETAVGLDLCKSG